MNNWFYKFKKCLNLRLLVIIIGLIGMIFGVVLMFAMFYGVGRRDQIELKMSAKNILILLFIVGIMLAFIKCISDIMLISGVIQHNTNSTKTWLFLNIIEIFFLLWIIPLFTYAIKSHLMQDLYFWSAYVIFNVGYIYSTFIVYCYHQRISKSIMLNVLTRSDSCVTISTIISEIDSSEEQQQQQQQHQHKF